MKVTTKKISETKVKLTVTLNKDDLASARQIAIKNLSKNVKAPGFRKGKVPADLAEQYLNPNEVAQAAVDAAVRRSVPLAFNEAKCFPIHIPEVSVTKYVPDESAEYTAEAEILPDIKLGDLKKLNVKKNVEKVTAKQIDAVLDNVLHAYAEKKATKKKAENGDEVLIDFEGAKDGKPFDGGKAKSYPLTLGSKSFIPGFEEGIVGPEPGDRFDLELTFPKDYGVKDLAGQKVNFNVLLKQVNVVTVPELDDKFAALCGPFKTVDDLKADIKKNLEQQAESRAADAYKDDLVDAFVKTCKVAAPEIMIKDQLKMLRTDVEQNAKRAGMDFETFLKASGIADEKEWEKQAKEIAETRVKSRLVLQILARDNQLDVEDAIVEAKLNELRHVYKNNKEAIENLKRPEVKQDIKNRLIIEDAVNFLVEANEKNQKTKKK